MELGDGLIGGFWDLEEAFRNDPYIVSFSRGNFDFALILLHTRWTDDDEGTRKGEVEMLAEHVLWMQNFIPERDWILAGDFNYAGTVQVMEDMAVNADLTQLDQNPPSTIRASGTGYTTSAYDHIFVPSHTASREYMPNSANTIDVIQLVYGTVNATNTRRARSELSDHLPVFAVFRTDQTDDDGN